MKMRRRLLCGRFSIFKPKLPERLEVSNPDLKGSLGRGIQNNTEMETSLWPRNPVLSSPILSPQPHSYILRYSYNLPIVSIVVPFLA